MPENSNIASGILGPIGLFFQRMEQEAQNGIGPVERILTSTINVLGKMVEPFSKVQDAAINLTKATGIASQGIMDLTTRIIAQNKAMSLSMTYNISSQEIGQLMADVMGGIGRNVQIDLVGNKVEGNDNFDSDIENLIAASKVFGNADVSEIVSGFDKLGKSMGAAAKRTGKLFQEAGAYGVNLKKYSDNFIKNLGMAQKYTFRDGVNGLQEMARKATEIRQDMSQVSAFAEKVGTVTGAVETAARLQVLGGSFTQLANPLAMLNEGLTNMEGLQERLIKMTEGAASYNSVTKQIEMDPLMKLRIRAAAESMGVNADNLLDQAFAQARRGEILSQMNGFGGFSEEVKKLLPNVGTIDEETGVAGAIIGNDFRSIGEISRSVELQNQLVAESRSESEDIKVIANEVMGIHDEISGRAHQIENQAALNKLDRGVFRGQSTLQHVTSALYNGFNPQSIAGAGRLDLPIENAQAAIVSTTLSDLFGGTMQAFTSSSIEEFNTKFGEAIHNIIGEGSVQDAVVKVVNNISTQVSNFSESVNRFSDKVDLLTSGGAISATEGRVPEQSGAPVPPSSRTPLAPSVNPYVSNGFTPPSIIEPQSRFGVPNDIGTVQWNANQATMPAITVVSSEQSQPTSQQGAASTNNEYTINIGGSLSMQVTGDNGNIGEVDLIKMLENNEQFRNELARVIAETMAKQNSNRGI